mmetsp:Transcript_7189/g.22502  ORF Transcript_7189/g.22502 Transcript_7189/m.22502 type:complete len:201 (+) Transcript_7189:499-1101(+)
MSFGRCELSTSGESTMLFLSSARLSVTRPATTVTKMNWSYVSSSVAAKVVMPSSSRLAALAKSRTSTEKRPSYTLRRLRRSQSPCFMSSFASARERSARSWSEKARPRRMRWKIRSIFGPVAMVLPVHSRLSARHLSRLPMDAKKSTLATSASRISLSPAFSSASRSASSSASSLASLSFVISLSSAAGIVAPMSSLTSS